MSMKFKEIEYGSPKQILAIPDHYVAFGYKHAKAVLGNTGNATLIDGRYVVKAGTIYPSNDSNAIGVVLNDYDVTDGDQMLAVVVHGYIKVAGLPVIPTSAAVSTLKQISFVPFTDMGIALTGTKASISVGATTDPNAVTFTLSGGEFRDGATTLANWTITGESVTKLTVSAITLSADKKSAIFTLDQTAAAVAGNVTVLPAASVISTGKTIASAVTIATVA